MITCHIPRMEPALQRFQVLLIKNHIWEGAVEMRRDREAKAMAHQVNTKKGVPGFLGSNITYLL